MRISIEEQLLRDTLGKEVKESLRGDRQVGCDIVANVALKLFRY